MRKLCSVHLPERLLRLTAKDPCSGEYKAYLDGEKLNYCVEADAENGTAVVLLTDGFGRFSLDPVDPSQLQTRQVRGEVLILRQDIPGPDSQPSPRRHIIIQDKV